MCQGFHSDEALSLFASGSPLDPRLVLLCGNLPAAVAATLNALYRPRIPEIYVVIRARHSQRTDGNRPRVDRTVKFLALLYRFEKSYNPLIPQYRRSSSNGGRHEGQIRKKFVFSSKNYNTDLGLKEELLAKCTKDTRNEILSKFEKEYIFVIYRS